MHWTVILTYAVVLLPAWVSAIIAFVCLFPTGRVVWNNVITLDVLQHLSLHAVFYAPAAALVFVKFIFTEQEVLTLGTTVKIGGVLSVFLTILIGWLCGYRVAQLEVLNPHGH